MIMKQQKQVNRDTITNMSDYKIRLVVSDIDMTLTWQFNQISELNRQAILDLQKNGILFGIASGRGYEDLRNYAPMWNIEKPFDMIIGLNGSSLYDEKTGEDEQFFWIDTDTVRSIVEKIDEADLDCHIYQDGITLFSRDSERYRKIRHAAGRNVMVAEKLSDLYRVPIAKVLINVDDDRMDEWRAYFKPVMDATGNNVKLIRTSPGAMEFVPAKSDKLYALKKYCERYDIPMSEVAAFGDTSNDNEMIEGAGLGVCMLNGTDDTKALADVISEYDAKDDGFARFIYAHIL